MSNIGRALDRGQVVQRVKDELSDHAKQQMQRRGVTEAMMAKVLARPPFSYWHDGQWKSGYYDPGLKIFIAKTIDGRINTVMTNVGQAYVNRLRSVRP